MSALEKKLKKIVRDHPDVRVAPHSPSGPYVRAVLCQAPGLLGQVVWEPDAEHWLVRAFPLDLGPDHQVDVHLTEESEIPAAITDVLDQLSH